MSIITSEIKRIFILSIDEKKIELDDPNPSYSVDEVKETYLNIYPQLLNSKMEYKGYQEDYKAIVFEFNSIAGTKA
ncbi:PRTRC system protein C [Tenacibaculum ovolyticum]|uniref:PRTRC system protein C n=1 Tax=Tenacibaculum ovolyticum TaxID=104270 RepID=UPI0007ED0A74|nr:PRTRC system protein C [Tenacibaculum ovolyticum]